MIDNHKLKYCLLLHCLGDTLGFKNGEWEFYSKDPYAAIYNKISEFLQLGGINQISLENWHASDDTIMHLAIMSCLKSNKWSNIQELEDLTCKKFIKLYNKFNTSNIQRYPGITTMKYLNMLSTTKWESFKFDNYAGGNGCSMRTLCIGIYFHNKLKSLLRYSINTSKMTHPNPIGWIGGLMSSYFAYCAINNIAINEWLFSFISMLNKHDILHKFVNINDVNELTSYHSAIHIIEKYINHKFDKNHNIIIDKSNIFLTNRIMKYNSMFTEGHREGKSGVSCCLIAYDCLIDSGENFEQLIFYTIMNNYDSDTIACISFGLYGLLYGLDNVPKNLYKNLEYKDKIDKLCL